MIMRLFSLFLFVLAFSMAQVAQAKTGAVSGPAISGTAKGSASPNVDIHSSYVPPEYIINADFSGNGIIDFADLMEFLRLYQLGNPRADINLSGTIDFADLSLLLSVYGQSVPEPSNPGTPPVGDNKFYLVAYSSPLGTVSPNGVIEAREGSSKTFQFSAGPNLRVADVIIDGESIGPRNSYTFENVRKHHSLTVSFEPIITKTIYVDNRLAGSCAGTYSFHQRNCSGSDGDAYSSLQPAANVARVYPAQNGQPEMGTTVIIREGIYDERGDSQRGIGSLQLKHSGTPENPITFKAAEGERVVINGADVLDSVTRCTSASSCLNLPNWQNIYKAALPQGVTIERSFMIQGGNNALNPAAMPDALDALNFVATDATWLNVPYNGYTVESIQNPGFFTSNISWVGAHIMVNTCNNTVFIKRITSFDAQLGKVYFEPLFNPGQCTLNVNHTTQTTSDKFKVINVPQGLDRPGEFYVDASNQMLYFWPLPDVSLTFEIATKNYGIEVASSKNVRIEGLEFRGYSGNFGGTSTNAAAIVNHLTGPNAGTRNLEIRKNKIYMMRGAGIGLSRASDTLIDGNEIRETSIGRGIQVSGGPNVITAHNFLYRPGRTGLYYGGTSDSAIVANTVLEGNGPHSNGMSTYQGSNNLLVALNKIIDSKIAWTFQSSSNLTVLGNLFVHSGGRAVAGWGGNMPDGTAPHSIFMKKNTILGSSAYIHPMFTNIVMENNIIPTAQGEHRNNVLTSAAAQPGENETVFSNLEELFVSLPNDNYLVLPGGMRGSPPLDICRMATDTGSVGALGCAGCLSNEPMAIFSASALQGYEPLEVTFNASASFACDNSSIVQYRWDFGDGLPPVNGSSQMVRTFSSGSYIVNLTVTDSAGREHSTAVSIQVLGAVEPYLVLHYPLDGTLEDFSGRNHHGTLNMQADNMANLFTTGYSGQAFSNAVSLSRIQIPNTPDLRGLEQVTFSIWAQRENASSSGYLLEKKGHYSLRLTNNQIIGTLFLQGGTVSISAPVTPDSEWHHYALTYDGSAMRLYYDGALVKTLEASGAIVDIGYDSWGHKLGSRGQTATQEVFSGMLDDYKIYERGLNTIQIHQIFETMRTQ